MQHSFTKCDMKHSFATVEKVKVIFQKLLFLTFAVKKGKNWEKNEKNFSYRRQNNLLLFLTFTDPYSKKYYFFLLYR